MTRLRNMGTRTKILSEIWKAIIKWLKQLWFKFKLKMVLDLIEAENQKEAEIERKKRFEPVYQEKPVDDVLQTGESRKLGGEMRLAAKWVIEAEENEARKP